MLFVAYDDYDDDDAMINDSRGTALVIGRDTVFLMSHSQLFPTVSKLVYHQTCEIAKIWRD